MAGCLGLHGTHSAMCGVSAFGVVVNTTATGQNPPTQQDVFRRAAEAKLRSARTMVVQSPCYTSSLRAAVIQYTEEPGKGRPLLPQRHGTAWGVRGRKGEGSQAGSVCDEVRGLVFKRGAGLNSAAFGGRAWSGRKVGRVDTGRSARGWREGR